MKVQTVAISALTPDPRNARKHDQRNLEVIAASLSQFGQRKPIVVTADKVVIAGNGTLEAAKSLGWTEIAVAEAPDDWDDATIRAYALADNRSAELAEWDDSVLNSMLDELAIEGWNITELGFDLPEVEPEPLAGDPDEVPEQVPSKTVPGDVWLLGPHRLVCGDSTSSTDVDKLMDGKLADMVWTDPPYGVSYEGKTKDALVIKNDGTDEALNVVDGAFDQILAATKKGSAVYVASPPGPISIEFGTKLIARKMMRQRLVWAKDSMVLGHSDYHYKHEDIYFGYTPDGEGRRGRGGLGWYGDNSQTSILDFARPKVNKVHPTMKPIELINYCLGNSSKPGDIVLDLFGGSGSTLIAAQSSGRIAYLMELDPHYCDVICARFQTLTGVLPIAESTGNEHDFLA